MYKLADLTSFEGAMSVAVGPVNIKFGFRQSEDKETQTQYIDRAIQTFIDVKEEETQTEDISQLLVTVYDKSSQTLGEKRLRHDFDGTDSFLFVSISNDFLNIISITDNIEFKRLKTTSISTTDNQTDTQFQTDSGFNRDFNKCLKMASNDRKRKCENVESMSRKKNRKLKLDFCLCCIL